MLELWTCNCNFLKFEMNVAGVRLWDGSIDDNRISVILLFDCFVGVVRTVDWRRLRLKLMDSWWQLSCLRRRFRPHSQRRL